MRKLENEKMRKYAVISLAVFLLSQYGFSEEYNVTKTSGPIIIDGKLDEAAWAGAEKLELKELKAGTPYKKESWYKVLYDNDNLYFGAYFAEREVEALVPKNAPEPRHLAERERDPDFKNTVMLNDSYAEVFLDPDGDGKQYIEFHINANGKVNDWWINKPIRTRDGLDTSPENFHMEWDCEGLKCGAFVDGSLNDPDNEDKGWSFELAIPVKSLKKFFKDRLSKITEIKLTTLLVRVDQFGKGQLYYSWPVIGEMNCHKPEKFGELKLR
jgi:hypothetical protein